jgi:N-acetylmuramic acid 6-phosphate (MurNAc-6-P) etherase
MTNTNTDKRRFGFLLPLAVLIAGLAAGPAALPSGQEAEPTLLKLLGLEASAESVDYVVNKTPFQLHTLLTEQRHPKTWTLSEKISASTETGLRMLFGVDEDVAAKLAALAEKPDDLEALAAAIEDSILARKTIYVYGCGATGRLAKQMESSFWRPFWRRVKAEPDLWAKVAGELGSDIEERLVGEMTGADRALISSLEGFEDLQLIGRLQLEDRGIDRGTLVIAVTEGGETSSVIGTAMGALDGWKSAPGYDPAESRKKIYFVYNNPDDLLRPFARSRSVLDEPGITKLNLTTGPQAITGSTRMQATTIETFVVGNVIEAAVERVLRRLLGRKDAARLGFGRETTIADRLRAFGPILEEVKRVVPSLARLTDLEANAYARGRFSTYFARTGLITVFIDSTERSPTFRLFPLDTVKEPRRKCWIQVWTEADGLEDAWRKFLGRPFRGLDPALYRKPFASGIEDPYLRDKALASLGKAGNDQALLYDFSFSEANTKKRGLRPGDIGVMALLPEDLGALSDPRSAPRRFERLAVQSGAGLGVVLVKNKAAAGDAAGPAFGAGADPKKTPVVAIALSVDPEGDPMEIRSHIALKTLLNAHSTAIMAKLGKVVGNTMTNVSPSNLKLVGRATHLIQLHVNDVLARPEWVRRYGPRRPISYGEANAVLFDAISFLKERATDIGQAAEVPLSIIRILESTRTKRRLTAEEAWEITKARGLAAYLAR